MRILGLGLAVAVVASAFAAASASAAKDPYNDNTWGQYADCPYENEELTDCFYGRTYGGKEGGEFQYGHVRVLLNKPVIIQGGFKGEEDTIEVSPPLNGVEAVESGPETIVHGLSVITTKIQENANWPQELKESFAAAKKNKETKATLKIQMAGNECFEVPGCLDTESLLFRSLEPPAFRLALKVTISNAWLEKLGGGPCQIGSDEHPIKQNLITGEAGNTGTLSFNKEFTNLQVENSELVDTKWHIAPESGATGCGGEYESYVDDALNKALELNEASRTGITWLHGNLHDGYREAVQGKHEEGNPELP
jgi:hypothetical protein